MAVYFFYGDEEYLMELEINKLKTKLLDKNFSSMNFRTLENPSFPNLTEALKTQGMMFGNIIIQIDCEKYFAQTFEDKQLEEIEDLMKNATVTIIFRAILPHSEGKKLDSRKKLFKILSSNATSKEFASIPTYKINELSDFIKNHAQKIDLKINQEATLTLINQVGNNLRELHSELEKLKLATYPDKTATKDLVQKLCISNEALFSLTDCLMKNDKENSIYEFNKLLEKKHPLEILSAIQTMLRKWILIKINSKTMSTFELSKLIGQHEFVIKQSILKMANTNLKNLVDLKQNLTKVEFDLKKGQSVDLKTEIETAILKS